VVGSLIEHVRPALTVSGDLSQIEPYVDQLMFRGNGARRQRQVATSTGRLSDVVADAVERTSA